MKCKYCKLKIKKKESVIVWQYSFSEIGGYYKRKVHSWCAKLGIEEKMYKKENPRHVRRRELLEKVSKAKELFKKEL